MFFFSRGKNLCPHLCPRAKMRAKIGFRTSLGAKMGISRLGYICIIYTQSGRPHFCHWPNTAILYLPGLCPIFAQRFQNFARFLLAEKLLDFQDFPVIAKQRCFNLIVLLYTTCDKKCFFNFLQPSFFIFLLASS